MKIEQALYGAARGGHSLLGSTGESLVAKELTSRLDLPDTAPYGVNWSPFLIGFPLRRHYILGRTMLDEHASRTGMVFTHALICPLEDMTRFDNLHDLISLLCERPCPDKPISTIELEAQQLPSVELAPEQMAIATLLAAYGKLPIVRPGCDSFDQVVADLWRRLWPGIRRGFAFRLSFSPNDLIESPVPALVCIPPNLSARWTGYRIVGTDRMPSSFSPAAALITRTQGSGDLLDYAARLGIEIGTFGNLVLLEQAYVMRASPGTLDNSVAILRIIEALCSGQPAVASGREEVLGGLLRFLPDASAKQVGSLRNLSLTCVDNPDRIWNALQQWMAKYKFPADEDAEVTRLLRGLDDDAYAIPEWRHAVVSGLNMSKSDPGSTFFQAFWRWGLNSHDVYEHVFRWIEFNGAEEDPLIKSAPDQMPGPSAQQLLSLSKSRHLYQLHGLAASMVFPPMEAARLQLSADSEGTSPLGIELALRRAQPKQIVDCALAFRSLRLSELAAAAVSSQPELLADVDMSAEAAQDIWSDALQKNTASWRGPREPAQAFQMILSRMLDSNKIETPLITILSKTPLADLAGYSRRKEVWECLGGNTRQRLIAASADGWLNQLVHGTATPIEVELQLHIVNSGSFRAIVNRFFSMSVEAALNLVSLLPVLNEEQFLEVLPLLTSKTLTLSEAGRLGGVLLSRQWSNAAERLTTLLRQGREDVRAALRACHSLLSSWMRFRLAVVPLSSDEKWQALEEIAADLYPSGPDHEGLWRRAGGRDADLQHHGNGRARWSDALFKVRRGRGLRVSKLVARMMEDYPGNTDLQCITRDREFR